MKLMFKFITQATHAPWAWAAFTFLLALKHKNAQN